MASATKVTGEAREVARAEAQAVLAMVVDEARRARLADVVAAVDEGAVEGAEADALAELLELGLSTEQWIPHSFGAFDSHHQRPARDGSSGPVARVQGAQPIDL